MTLATATFSLEQEDEKELFWSFWRMRKDFLANGSAPFASDKQSMFLRRKIESDEGANEMDCLLSLGLSKFAPAKATHCVLIQKFWASSGEGWKAPAGKAKAQRPKRDGWLVWIDAFGIVGTHQVVYNQETYDPISISGAGNAA